MEYLGEVNSFPDKQKGQCLVAQKPCKKPDGFVWGRDREYPQAGVDQIQAEDWARYTVLIDSSKKLCQN